MAFTLAFLSLAAAARAQAPVTVAGGRLTLSGQASASVGTNDEGYFNYTNYAYNLLRLFRLDGTADLRINDHLSVLGDLRGLASTDSGNWLVRPYALFARIRPWTDHAIDIQAGLIPPVFGTFSRHAYETDTPLVGYPLAYQYLTALRGNALPATVSDLLRMRGRGWLTHYPAGETAPESGLPLVDGMRYQSGVEVHAGSLQPLEAAIAWTSGALSTPAYEEGNAGRQISGRVAVRPVAGLILGISGSRGTFLSPALRDVVSFADAGDQRAVGFDAEYSRGHYLVRTEGVFSNWRLPLAAGGSVLSLDALGIDLEGRYRISPRVYVAARVDHVGFGDVAGPVGQTPWEFPVWREQLGGGYLVSRHALVKVEWQHNARDASAGTAPAPYDAGAANSYNSSHLVSVQLVVWF